MKLTYPTPTSLRIRVVPWFIWIVSAIFIAVGVFMLASGSGQTRTLQCERADRDALNCTLRQSFFGIPTATTVLNNVYGARLDASRGRSSTTYRVEFDTAHGDVPLSRIWSSSTGDKQPFVDQVNRMVRDPSVPSITVRNLGIEDLLFDLLFIGIGACIGPLFGAALVTWTFDTVAGTFTVQRTRLGRAQVAQHALRDIRSALVLRSTSSKGTAMSRIAVRLRSGEEIPLTGYASSGNVAHDEATVSTIQQFIGLDPTIDQATDDVPAMQPAPVAASIPAPLQVASMPMNTPLATGFVPTSAAALPLNVANNGVLVRLIGVVLLQRPVYRVVVEDPAMTAPAGMIVVGGAALVGCISGLTSTSLAVNGMHLPPGLVHAAASVTTHVLSAALSWLIGSVVFALIAKAWGGNTNVGEMARGLGFASVFNVLWVSSLGIIPAVLLIARGTMLAVGEAAEFDTRRVILTTVISWLVMLLLGGVLSLVLNLVVLSGMISLYGQPV